MDSEERKASTVGKAEGCTKIRVSCGERVRMETGQRGVVSVVRCLSWSFDGSCFKERVSLKVVRPEAWVTEMVRKYDWSVIQAPSR
jgi:hypothetical protein